MSWKSIIQKAKEAAPVQSVNGETGDVTVDADVPDNTGGTGSYSGWSTIGSDSGTVSSTGGPSNYHSVSEKCNCVRVDGWSEYSGSGSTYTITVYYSSGYDEEFTFETSQTKTFQHFHGDIDGYRVNFNSDGTSSEEYDYTIEAHSTSHNHPI